MLCWAGMRIDPDHPEGKDHYLLVRSGGYRCAIPVEAAKLVTKAPKIYPLNSSEPRLLGLAQIAKIRGEMEEVLAEHYEGESIEEFVRRINVDAEFTFRSEEDVLAYSVDSLNAARQKMADVFGLLPKADVVIKPYPAFAASGVGEYHSSSEDGTRPGIFYIAVRDPENRTRATQQSTLHHETYPGHHLQGAIALELGDKVHALARYLWNSGYGEGWALYSERVDNLLNRHAW